MIVRKHSLYLAVAVTAVLLVSSAAKADLVGLWELNGDASDTSGHGNDGTLIGGATFSADVPPPPGGGMSLSVGAGSHVLVGDDDALDITGAITLGAWVKPTFTAWEGILAKAPSDGSIAPHAGNYEFRIESGGQRLQFLHQRGGVNDTAGYTSVLAVPNDGAWHHVAVTAVDGATVNFYLDGKPAGSSAHVGSFGATNSSPLYIGTRGDVTGTPFDGLLDRITIFDHALTGSQVSALLAGVAPPPAAYPDLPYVTAQASTQFGGREAIGAVNGSGLLGREHVIAPSPYMWLSASGDSAPEFTLDLGSVHNVNELRVWNYNEDASPAACCLGRGVQTADIYVAGDDGVFGATPHISGQSFAIAPGTLSDFSEVVNLGGVAARYVKIDVTSNHGDPSFTGLSEVNVVADTIEGVSAIAAKIHSVSSNLAGFNRKADYLVNRSGMFGEIHGIVPEGSMWLSQGTFNSAGELEVPDTSPEVTFDMGSVVDLHRMKVYNYNEYNEGHALEAQLLGRGVASMDVMVAGDDLNFTTLIAGLPVDVAPTAGDTIDIGQIVDLGGTSARYVKFVVLSNHNGRDFTDPLGDDTFDNFAGLSEVRFYAVPEPASAALAAMCLIAVAGFGRRRRQ